MLLLGKFDVFLLLIWGIYQKFVDEADEIGVLNSMVCCFFSMLIGADNCLI